MTEQEQQLINAILRIDHASAPEVAMALVKGIDQTVDNRLRKMAEYVKQLSSHHPEVQEITDNLNRYLAYTIKGTTDNEYGNHPIDFTARILALLFFYPDNEQKFIDVETIGGFEPLNANERFSFLLDGCSIDDEGKPQFSNWYNGCSRSNSISFFLHLIGGCPEDLNTDESLRRSNITKLYLRFYQLSALPPNIGNLTSLTKLYLGNNQLSSEQKHQIQAQCTFAKV